jgi:hypothetical protein
MLYTLYLSLVQCIQLQQEESKRLVLRLELELELEGELRELYLQVPNPRVFILGWGKETYMNIPIKSGRGWFRSLGKSKTKKLFLSFQFACQMSCVMLITLELTVNEAENAGDKVPKGNRLNITVVI